MPSYARRTFERAPLNDVRVLQQLHREQHPGPGRPGSALTRSGIFLLCAAWELYSEEVLLELVECLITYNEDPMSLPREVKKGLAESLKADKHELAALRLAGTGWKQCLRNYAKSVVGGLNTPSSANLNPLFKRLCGLDASEALDPVSIQLNEFIAKRGDIAHRGAQAGHISITDLDADFEFICSLIDRLDNYLIVPMREIVGYQPWNRRNG